MTRTPRILLILAAMLPWWATHAAEPWGRLFFTPSQRATLDAGKPVAKPRTARSVRAAAPRGPRGVTLNGVVTRSDGETVVWVNGHEAGGETVAGVSASTSASDPTSAQVKVVGARNPVELRVGQHLDSVSGKVLEPYESAVSGAPAVQRSRKKSVRKDASPPMDRPPKTSKADADEPSSE